MKSLRVNMNTHKRIDKLEFALEELAYAAEKSSLKSLENVEAKIKRLLILVYLIWFGFQTSLVLNNSKRFDANKDT